MSRDFGSNQRKTNHRKLEWDGTFLMNSLCHRHHHHAHSKPVNLGESVIHVAHASFHIPAAAITTVTTKNSMLVTLFPHYNYKTVFITITYISL